MLTEVLASCHSVAVFLLTLGEGPDQRIREAMTARPHYGYILDAVAAVAAESIARYVQDRIDESLDSDEMTTLRYSPGYCDWPITDQEKIFALLPSDRIGVRLLDNALMSPSKSISGLIGIGAKEAVKASGNACRTCEKKNCPHRREAA